MADIDHFKRVNDTYGHATGDRVLQTVARTLKEGLRTADVCARYGGEEFAVLLPGTALEEAAAILDRLRCATPGDQTVSIGYAQREPGEPISETVDRADHALYQAKSAGRDRIVAHEAALLPVGG
jgi:diguanylate cyclase (GGDEF)-like protein